jgi:TolB-like protein
MKSILPFLFLFCCIHSISAQSISESDIDLLSAELSKQAIARNTLKLAVLDFTESNSITDFSLAVSEELRIHMAVNNASLTIVDRAATERVMEEQRLSSSPLFDENKAATLGKLVSADAIVTGTLIRQGGNSRVTAKMISVETGAVIGGYSINLKNTGYNDGKSQGANALPTVVKPPKQISFHAEANTGLLFVNQTAAPSVGFTFSRLTYRGELHESRYKKGKKGFTCGLNYHIGLPVKPTHDYVLGYRTQDGYGNVVSLNEAYIYQDSYFLFRPDAQVQVTIPSNTIQVPVFILTTCDRIRVDRLRVDVGWRHTLFEKSVRVYAESGLAWVKQFDRSTYLTSTFSSQHESMLTYQVNGNVAPAELPNLWEFKAAVGVEHGRWSIHLEGAVTTRNTDYMSPLDMFHHPEMTSWGSVKGDLASKGVAEITSQSASENWYYWYSSIIQLRYQL